MGKLKTFEHNDKSLNVKFIETQQVKDGVSCDVYEFIDDSSRDLGIVSVEAGSKTPKQKILSGDKTIEGFISGKGTLRVAKPAGETIEYIFPGNVTAIELHVGDIMQWDAQTDLQFYEICYPAYTDGRFQNLE